MKLDLLAIAAHPDDAELTCGGTLARMVAAGYQVGILDLTRGEMGTRGTPEIRAREADCAAQALGVQHRENLGLPDANVEPNQENKLKVAARIRALRPRSVILPYWEARHPDHYNASHLAYEACFLAGLKQLSLEGEAYRPFKILYATMYAETVRPSFIVDITAQFDRRLQAIRCYESQFARKQPSKDGSVYIPLDDLEEHVTRMARHYGAMIGVKYGEPFLVREVMQVDDIVQMPVRSI